MQRQLEKPSRLERVARPRIGVWLAVLALAVLVGAGCHVMQQTAELPGKAFQAVTPGSKAPAAPAPQELEDQLMRFADSFSGAMVNGLTAVGQSTNALPAQEILQLKIAFLSSTLGIATGPNPIADVLDMTVLVTLSRMTLENYWVPRRGDEATRALLNICKQSEPEIWQMAGTVLSPQQQKDLQDSIKAYYEKHSGENRIFYMRAIGLAAEVAKSSSTPKTSSTGVFSMLGLDPLSGLDPATREIALTRMAVERALYLVQRMPQLVSLQSELLSMQLMALPQVRQVVSNTTEISASVDRLSRLADELPNRLEADQSHLKDLLAESHQTLEAGRQMSDSLNTTLKTFDALMKRFGVGEPSTSPPDTNSPPFNILDYAKTADQLALASKQLESLLLAFNNTLDSAAWNQRLKDLDAVSQRAQTDTNAVLNHAFFVGAMLIVVAFFCALIYRFIVVKVIKPSR